MFPIRDWNRPIKEIIKKILKRAGFELIRSRPHVVDVLLSRNIDVVFDVGANIGQFGHDLRTNGYRGRIISFEPLSSAFEVLKENISGDLLWEAVNIGLGSAAGSSTINVSRITEYSSFLKPLPLLEAFAPEKIEIVGKEEITIDTVDSQFSRRVRDHERVFLKIDTQGYEKQVISGAASSLSRIAGIQLELSPTPLYSGESSLAEMVALLDQKGFSAALIDPVNFDKRKGVLLQIDCVFLRR